MKKDTVKISATWSRTIQVHQYEPERIDVAAEMTIEGGILDVKEATDNLLKQVKDAGQQHVLARLDELEALRNAASRPNTGPVAPDPFVGSSL